MGHDIFGYRKAPSNDDAREEVSYLRRAAWNDLAREIYIALNATDFDCGCSGCGGGKFFTRAELNAALHKLPGSDDLLPEKKFLLECISDNEEGVYINFC